MDEIMGLDTCDRYREVQVDQCLAPNPDACPACDEIDECLHLLISDAIAAEYEIIHRPQWHAELNAALPW